MKRLVATLVVEDDQGSFWAAHDLEGGRFACALAMLPYRDADGDSLSDNNRSRLPRGVYVFRLVDSPHFGRVYGMGKSDAAPNRANVLIHGGNLAGDVDKGWETDSEGCVLPGVAIEVFPAGAKVGKRHDGTPRVLKRAQRGVSASGSALKALAFYYGGEPFELEITA